MLCYTEGKGTVQRKADTLAGLLPERTRRRREGEDVVYISAVKKHHKRRKI